MKPRFASIFDDPNKVRGLLQIRSPRDRMLQSTGVLEAGRETSQCGRQVL
jgi:hypothetical protein